MAEFPATDRTTLRRLPERGSREREVVYAILDEAPICHVGFVEDGQPFVIPTIHARDGATLYLHDSPASRMLRALAGGTPVCVTATILDGVVLARSAFHSSMNYRSALVLGTARRIDDPAAKLRAMEMVTERVMPGRWADTRGPTDTEFRATLLVSLPLDEASAKVRTGPPGDDDDDVALAHWAGVVPLSLRAGEPQPAPDLPPGVEVPGYVHSYRSPFP